MTRKALNFMVAYLGSVNQVLFKSCSSGWRQNGGIFFIIGVNTQFKCLKILIFINVNWGWREGGGTSFWVLIYTRYKQLCTVLLKLNKNA